MIPKESQKPGIMSHPQQGWAVVQIKYKHKTRRIEEKREELEKRTVDSGGKLVQNGPAFDCATRFETGDTTVDHWDETYWG